ncbi:MAG TPA: molybdopterin cofactor-binding domain-containing protein, partial [Chloroflexota bacterium]|nr:molybdopterin cofactor-binding domain-containing protein [Chloroflexota bacterium]
LQIISARALDVPQEAVRVGEPDTANELFFTGVSSQRTTMQMGAAVVRAADELRAGMIAAAARLHETPAERWSLREGELAGPEGASMTLHELATNLPPSRSLEGRGAFRTREARARESLGRDHWTAGAMAVETALDEETGDIRLLRCSAVADAGKVLHYASAKGQVEGGVVLGIGLSLLEDLIYEDGQMQNGDPFQYRLPKMRDVPPEFPVVMLENEDGPGPYGSKAMAQTSVPCVVPAVANAVYDASGVRLTEAPFTPERVLRALGKL